METILIIASLIVIVFGFLQIILFFKVWGMTNNIARITKYSAPASFEQLVKDVRYGKNSNIEYLLFNALYNDMENVFRTDMGEGYSEVINKYKPLYKMAGIEFPQIFEGIKNDDNWMNTFINIR